MSKLLSILHIRDCVITQKGIKPLLLKEKTFENAIPYLDISVLESGQVKEYSFKELGSIASENDVLVVWDGSRSGLAFRGQYGLIGSTIMGLTPIELDRDYFFYFLKSQFTYINGNLIGTGIPHVNPELFFNLQIPYYSIQDQKQLIVGLHKKIKESLVILEEQKEIVKQALLDTYINFEINEDIEGTIQKFKEAVLKTAFEGDLFASKKQKDNFTIRKVTGFERLFDYPVHWKTESILNLGSLNRGKSTFRPRNDSRLFGGTYPFIQTGDVTNSNGYILSNSVFYSEFGLAQSKLFPEGTVCITIAANIGKTAMLTYPACFPDSIVGFIANEKVLPKFVMFFFKAIEKQLESASASNAAQKNINIKILSSISIPLPDIEEQEKIVEKVEELLAIADAVGKQFKESVLYFERLEESILHEIYKVTETEINLSTKDKVFKKIQSERKQIENHRKEENSNKSKIRNAMKKEIEKKREIEDILKSTPVISTEDLWKESIYFETKDVESFYEELIRLRKENTISSSFENADKLTTKITYHAN